MSDDTTTAAAPALPPSSVITKTPFDQAIDKFNAMYSLPGGDVPNLASVGGAVQRLLSFAKILREEMEEMGEILHLIHNGKDTEALVSLADWYGDMIVYCASEAKRYGITIGPVLDVIMESNFSKLGADGKAIIDADGKVQKGPNYFKPEPKLAALLQSWTPIPVV